MGKRIVGWIMKGFDHTSRPAHRARGQGLVEAALLFPLILIVLSGLVEFGFMLNEYLATQDASRNTARYISDSLYSERDSIEDCATTLDFFRQAKCRIYLELAQERPQIQLNFLNSSDDIIVSAFSIAQNHCEPPATFPPTPASPPGSGVSCVTARHPAADGESGWSASQDTRGARNRASRFTTDDVNARLSSLAPSTGVVIVEIFYDYRMKLNLPWITQFFGEVVTLHNYTIMPLVSAEPTPTPPP